MKTKLFSVLSGVVLLLSAGACHSPEEYSTPLGRDGEGSIQSFKAYFPDEDMGKENEFLGEIDYDNHTINVVFPYNYPRLSDNVLQLEAISRVRVVANLLSTVTLKEPITFMDLTQANTITVVDPQGKEVPFTVTGEIRKSNECQILEFSLVESEAVGVVNQGTRIITLPVAELPVDKAVYKISHGATISPDPAAEAFDFGNPDAKITVTAQNGVDQTVYTFEQGDAPKIPNGFRPESAQLIWAKRMGDIGLNDANVQAGVAMVGDYVVVNETGTMSAPVLSVKTGEVVDHMDLSGIGEGNNYYMTADDAGHILVSNSSAANNNDLIIWKFDGIHSDPEIFLKINSSGNVGFKVSATGDVTKKAVVTAPISGTGIQFCRWIINGDNVDYKLETAPNWTVQWGNVDVVWTKNSDPNADYFVNAYAEYGSNGRGLAWHTANGGSKGFCLNTDKGVADSGNWVVGGVDYINFNNCGYVMFSSANIWTWGTNDRIKILDCSANNLTVNAVDTDETGLNLNGNYGAKACGNVGVHGNANSVAMHQSADGYYLYMCFQFAKGYVGCIRTDCIKY